MPSPYEICKVLSLLDSEKPDMSMVQRLIKQAQYHAQLDVPTQYVWLTDGLSTFSETWNYVDRFPSLLDMEKYGPIQLLKDVDSVVDQTKSKLLEYRCLNDASFKFNSLMHLR